MLCFSGHDPTGGAGIQADIETLVRLECHPLTVVTALTEQDTVDVHRVWAQREAEFLAQARCLLSDIRPAAVKIGLLGSSEIARAVAELLADLPGIPVVLDPILAAGGGAPLARSELIRVLRETLVPVTSVLTPNSAEARQLAGGLEDLNDCAGEFMQLGCAHVLITGTHEASDEVVNRLYTSEGERNWSWPRLPHTYHGSGCTLAAALAGLLARGLALDEAAYQAQWFTYEALKAAYAMGRGQYLPNRLAGVTTASNSAT